LPSDFLVLQEWLDYLVSLFFASTSLFWFFDTVGVTCAELLLIEILLCRGSRVENSVSFSRCWGYDVILRVNLMWILEVNPLRLRRYLTKVFPFILVRVVEARYLLILDQQRIIRTLIIVLDVWIQLARALVVVKRREVDVRVVLHHYLRTWSWLVQVPIARPLEIFINSGKGLFICIKRRTAMIKNL